MNTRHIQSFLIVSAAFFSMTGPVHARGASALAAAGAQMQQIVPAGTPSRSRRPSAPSSRRRTRVDPLARPAGRAGMKGGNPRIPALFFAPPDRAGRRVARAAARRMCQALSCTTPRRIWSSSIDSNSALKLPSPKLVALALDDLEEDRPDLVLGEDLQQQVVACAVDQDLALLQFVQRFAVIRHAAVDQFVIRVDRVEQLHFLAAQAIDRLIDVGGAERDVLDAFAVIRVEVFLDLAGRIRPPR